MFLFSKVESTIYVAHIFVITFYHFISMNIYPNWNIHKYYTTNKLGYLAKCYKCQKNMPIVKYLFKFKYNLLTNNIVIINFDICGCVINITSVRHSHKNVTDNKERPKSDINSCEASLYAKDKISRYVCSVTILHPLGDSVLY